MLITGAGGYVGKAVVQALLKDGWHVRALVRRPGKNPEDPRYEERIGDIRDEPAALAGAMADCSALVHLAAAKSDEPWSGDVNVRGTANVWEGARLAGVTRAIYMSTQSAKLKHPGTYGRTKREGENVVRSSDVPWIVLRPSLVYGDGDEGVFGALKRSAKLPIVPIFGPGTAVFRPIHVNDLSTVVVRSLTAPCVGRTFDAGGPDTVTFDALIGEVLHRSNIRRPFLHVPRFVGYALAMLPRSPITRSNVRGGIERIPMEIGPMREVLNVEPRAFRTDTTFERTLLRYVFGGIVPRWNPPADVVARLTDAMRVHGVPAAILPSNRLLGPIDAATRLLWPNGSLQRSLRVAAAVAECQPEGADTLLPKKISAISVLAKSLGLCIHASLSILVGLLLAAVFFPYVRRHGA